MPQNPQYKCVNRPAECAEQGAAGDKAQKNHNRKYKHNNLHGKLERYQRLVVFIIVVVSRYVQVMHLCCYCIVM